MVKKHFRNPGKWKKGSEGGIPETAVVGGVDEHGNTVYVGRAVFEGGVIPGTVHPSRGVCCVPYDGQESGHSKYQVLANPKNVDLIWVPASKGHVPTGAIEGGRDPNGEGYFIGRFHHKGAVLVGKIHCSHGVCYVPHDGAEVSSPYYEVLTLKTARIIMDESGSSSSSSDDDD